MGWQTYSVVHPDAVQDICGKSVQLIEDLPKQLDGTAMASSGSNAIQLPKSACLGVLGTAEIFFRYIKLWGYAPIEDMGYFKKDKITMKNQIFGGTFNFESLQIHSPLSYTNVKSAVTA